MDGYLKVYHHDSVHRSTVGQGTAVLRGAWFEADYPEDLPAWQAFEREYKADATAG